MVPVSNLAPPLLLRLRVDPMIDSLGRWKPKFVCSIESSTVFKLINSGDEGTISSSSSPILKVSYKDFVEFPSLGSKSIGRIIISRH
jgi:hypothetical protein